MLKLRRTRSADAADVEEPSASAEAELPDEEEDDIDDGDDGGEEPVRGRMAPLGVGLRVTALVVVGIVMIAVLAQLGDVRLSGIVGSGQEERAALDKDRTEMSAVIAQAHRTESATSTALGTYSRAALAMVIPGSGSSAGGETAQKAITELAQSLEPLEAASRGLAVAVTRSTLLEPYEIEGIDPQAEAALIQRNRERAASILRIARELPANLAELVLEHEALAASLVAGNVTDSRDRHDARVVPKAQALQAQLGSLHAALVDFSADIGVRHGALARAIHELTTAQYEDQRSSIRLQMILLVVVLSAGAVFIALYGLAMPLADLAEAATRFSSGQYDAPVSVLGRRDEIGKLSSALEQLRESAAETQRTSAEKLREQSETERRTRVQLEREVQQLRRDRDRLERERAERIEVPTGPRPGEEPEELRARIRDELLGEVLDEVRGDIRTDIRAEVEAEAERRVAEIQAAAERRLADAEASAQHMAREAETQYRETLATAEAELVRLKDELARALAQPAQVAPEFDMAAHREVVARLEAEIARLKGAQGASQSEREKDAEIARLRDEIDKAQKAQVANVSGERELARQRAEFDNERTQLNKAAQDAHRRATASDQALQKAAADAAELSRRHASAIELERQQRTDEVESLRAAHTRALAETQRRLTEQFSDRIRVLNALANDFESSISSLLTAAQAAAGEIEAAGARIGGASARSGQRSQDITARIGRASAGIRASVTAAEQMASAFSEMARQATLATRSAGSAIESTRAAGGALQGLALAARRLSETTQTMAELAERSNLLALNASIEAARAGEGGSGFSVVAAEVKALANRATRASKDISERMAEVMRSIGDATGALGTIGTTLNDTDTAAGAAARAIESQGGNARALVLGIHAAAEGAEGVGRSVAEVTAGVDEASRAAASLQAAADTLADKGVTLRAKIEEFLAAIRAA